MCQGWLRHCTFCDAVVLSLSVFAGHVLSGEMFGSIGCCAIGRYTSYSGGGVLSFSSYSSCRSCCACLRMLVLRSTKDSSIGECNTFGGFQTAASCLLLVVLCSSTLRSR